MNQPRLSLRFVAVFTIFTTGLLIGQESSSARIIQETTQTGSKASRLAKKIETPAKIANAQGEWIQLFNGKDLTGWTPKIRGHELGDNYADTFRVTDGLLTVSYDKYKPQDFLSMDGKNKKSWEKFGHLFYNGTFSNYILRVEYRFIGDQVENGPGWAFRNNGLMLHGQDPAKMTKDQKFPVSIEVQLLGAGETGERSTLNLCTPGTNVVMNGELFKKHCTSSSSQSFRGDQWVTVEVEVLGNEVIRHKIDGKTVLQYTNPQYDPRDKEAQQFIVDDNLMISSGTISLQSESHSTQFRKIELKNLDTIINQTQRCPCPCFLSKKSCWPLRFRLPRFRCR